MTRIWPNAHLAATHAPKTTRPPLAWDTTTHLLSRFAFGPTPLSRAAVKSGGADHWFADQLALGKTYAGYRGSASVAAVGPLLSKTPAQVRAWLKANGNEFGWEMMDQLGKVTLGLQAWSPAQLYETVVDFFANHLNVANHNSDVWSTRHTMDRDVIRKYALGSFTDMLLASARNPAMLQYLDLASSDQKNINENYGRELLELHTVGIGYTEDDVKNSARILTGRTLDADFKYVFNPAKHWVGPINVFGFRHANTSAAAGEAAGDAYLRFLAAHPKTAQRLATKLCIRFVSDAPSSSLVNQVAAAYLSHGTQIVPMLQTIFHSEEFWSSRGLKTRRPTENLLATVRILNVKPANTSTALDVFVWMTRAMGHLPLDWAPPNGYPDLASQWRSSGNLVNLWTSHRALSGNWWSQFAKIDIKSAYGGVRPATSGAAIDALTRNLTGMPFPAAHKAALQTFLQEPAATPIAKSQLQWYLGHLIPVILDSPQHSLR